MLESKSNRNDSVSDLIDTSDITASNQKGPLKVVHVCMQEFGGAGKAAYRLHKGLQSIGVNSTMVVFDKKKDDPSIKVLPESFSGGNLSCLDVPAFESRVWRRAMIRWENISKFYPDQPAGLELFSDAESEVRLDFIKEIQDADIINLHWVAGMLNYPKLPQMFRNKHIVWTLHDMNPFTGGCHYSGDCLKYTQSCEACPQLGSNTTEDLSRQAWKQKFDAYKDINITVVTPSRWLGKCAYESTLFSQFPINVIPYGFPLDVFKPYPKAEVLKALNVSPSAKIILFGAACIVNQRKGFRYLLDAIEKLSLKNGQENIIFTFGTLPQGVNINSKYPIYSLGSIVDENKLAMIYSAADVFVIPSLEDNLPNTVVEAMACGVPVVGFDIGGIPDMIDHKKTGYLVPPKDTIALAEGIEWVLSSYARGENLSAQCRQKAVNQYALEIQATNYKALYTRLLQSKKSQYIVSAIVSTYNAERFIYGCLEDLVNQTLCKKGKLEIVVVNSGSQQNEDAVVREFQQKYDNIKYIRTDQRETVYQAWNRGIKAARGKYITNANTDDRLREDAYERKIQILENNPHVGVVYADQWISEVPNEKFCDCKKEQGLIWPEFFPELGISVCIFGSQPMWRRDLHEKYGLFDERFKSAGDFEFWSRVSDKVECRHIPDFLGVYYSNPDGIEESYGHNASETKQIRQYYRRGLKNTKSRLSLFSDLTSVFHKIRIFRNQAKTAKHRSAVSVIIPMYNSSQYIVETLESIIQQTANNFEIVMIDDGSIDDCVQKAIKCLEKTDIPATILSIPHRGSAVARNIGVFYSTGQFILPFDSDDIMMPEMVADFHNKLSSDTSLGFAYCDVEYFEDMQKIRGMGDVDVNNFMWENQAHACSMFRKTAWVDASGYYAKMKYGDEDWDLWLEMLEKGWKACHIPKPNFRYRWRKKSRTSKLVSEHWAHMKSQLVLNHPDIYPEVYRRWAALENKSHYESLTVREMTYLLLLYCAELPRWRNIYWWTEAKKKLCHLKQMLINNQQLESRLEEMSKLIDFNIQVKSNGRLTKKDKKVEVIEYARKPEISVIIPLYNHERFIEMAISSVLEQSFPDFELIIINDGSTDNSAKIVKKFNDNRIRYVSRANKGAYETINEGVRLAKGEYISILNSDDFYDKDRLKKCINILKNNRSLAAVFSYINIIDGHGNLMDLKEGDKSNWGKIKNKLTFENQVNPLLSLLAGNFLVTTSNLFCKKEIFNKIGYFRNLRYTHDYDMFLRICQNFKTYILPELLLFYRVHSSNSSKENRAQVCFEVGLLLTDFLLNNDIFHKNGIEGYYEFITKFYNSINTYGADRMILTLLVMAKYDEKFKNIFFNELIDNENNLFRKSCIDEFRKILPVTSAVPKELPSTLEAENDKNPQGLEIGPRKQRERLKEDDEIRNKYSGMLLSSWPSTVRSPDNESELKVLQDRKRTAVSPCVPHTPAKIKVAVFRSYFTKPLYTALVSYPQIDAVLVDDLEEMIEMLRGHELEAVVTPDPELKQYTPKSIFSFLINHGLADKNYTSHPSKIDGHNAYLVAGQALRERALQTGLYDEKYLLLVGYLPFDYLFTGEFPDSKKFLEEMNLDLSKKTVLYAPTWNGLGNYSSLFSDGEQIVKAVSEKYNLIIKYHWNIPREIEQKKQGFEQFHLIKQYAEKRKNTRIISGTQILKCINACNVLIGDTSSVILEAMCLDKPVIFWDKAVRRSLYGIDEEARNAGVSVKSRTGLENAVELSMANPRYLSENRKKIAARASLPIDGKCGQRAARAVYEILAQKTSKRALALKNNNANLTGHVKCLTSNLALK